ncbi:type II secretion system assembly factor GspB [Brenneria goodwinii]|uniref:type II secretion system assembly factor GspB n=1 Tax=Brenneria goodwinii TaxID=1109412 RepID=UPI0036E75041
MPERDELIEGGGKIETESENAAEPARENSTGYRMPGYLLAAYALLLVALGWFSGQRWGGASLTIPPQPAFAQRVEAPAAANTPLSRAPAVSERQAAPAAPMRDGELPMLSYSAHVYTTDAAERSITLNGQRYRERDSPVAGLIIEQIQQDVTVFSFNGEPFILDALQDWPGGKVNSEEQGESGQLPPD